MFGFLNNLPQVTKNILLLNIMFFVVTLFLESQGIDLIQTLGVHHILSPKFEPYQIVTHFFMHAGFFHIFFNMWLFVMLGGYLERIWGPQRFFIFYFASAMGSFLLYNAVGYNEMLNLINELNANNISVAELNAIIVNNNDEAFNELIIQNQSNTQLIKDYAALSFVPMVGASGAIFGVMSAFTILFPNTEFYLYFAIPVKAKYLVGIYFVYEVYMSFAAPNDGTAHLAHVGGAIVGAIIVLIWRRTDRQNFY